MKANACAKVAAIILITLGSVGFFGTCTKVVYEPVPLDRPQRPVMPHVEEHELECLSDETFSRLLERERLRREYAEDLEVIIDTTQPE